MRTSQTGATTVWRVSTQFLTCQSLYFKSFVAVSQFLLFEPASKIVSKVSKSIEQLFWWSKLFSGFTRIKKSTQITYCSLFQMKTATQKISLEDFLGHFFGFKLLQLIVPFPFLFPSSAGIKIPWVFEPASRWPTLKWPGTIKHKSITIFLTDVLNLKGFAFHLTLHSPHQTFYKLHTFWF